MALNTVCPIDLCTGCSACKHICPKACIHFQEDVLGHPYPFIDLNQCVECNKCRSVCHIIQQDSVRYYKVQKTYAAWSNNREVRENSASGGIASEILLMCVQQNIFCMAAKLEVEKGCYYHMVEKADDIKWARKSKYVFSDMSSSFGEYELRLLRGQRCIFIGLPCQTAALITYLKNKKVSIDNLYTVELICHGVPSWKMLDGHLKHIEAKKNAKIHSVYFREKSAFYLICKDSNENEIYRKYIKSDDEYWRGFTAGLTLRESCYQCRYAKKERQSDMTIGDFPGIGRNDPDYERGGGRKTQISCVIVNSAKGIQLLKGLVLRDCQFVERDIMEVMDDVGNPQLRKPMLKNIHRELFEGLYKEKNFERAVRCSLSNDYRKYYMALPLRKLKKLAKSIYQR